MEWKLRGTGYQHCMLYFTVQYAAFSTFVVRPMNEMFLADNLYIFGDYRMMQYELRYEVEMLRIFLHLFFFALHDWDTRLYIP